MVVFRYTMMRLLLFAGVFAVLLLLRIEPIWAAVGGALVSMVLSFFLLRPDRERIAAGIDDKVQDRIARRQEKIDSERTLEDEEDSEAFGEGDPRS